jgi:hypothetical protein
MIDASARQVQEPRLATRDLTLAIATFIWTRLPCARYDRLIPFLLLILIGRLVILDTWSIQASYVVDSSVTSKHHQMIMVSLPTVGREEITIRGRVVG